LQQRFLDDIDILKSGIQPHDFLARPLPAELHQQGRTFAKILCELGFGYDWWAEWYEERLRGEPLNSVFLERCLNLPESLTEQGSAAINAYLRTITRREASDKLNRIRIMFIGSGQSGKTSLIRTLHGEPVIPGKEDMTPGIEIRDWPVPESDIKAHLWDFGGQVMSHATHQFFLREMFPKSYKYISHNCYS
jgi:hypothetical protein